METTTNTTDTAGVLPLLGHASLVAASTKVPGSSTVAMALTLVVLGAYWLYTWALPKPIPGIPYNAKAARSVFGDTTDLLREVRTTDQFHLWCANQVVKLNSPVCQVFVRPLSRPWVLMADFAESQDIMLRRHGDEGFDRSTFICNGMLPVGHASPGAPTGDGWRESRAWTQDLMAPSFLNGFAGPAAYDCAADLVSLWKIKARLARDRPFWARDDLHRLSTDTMLQFSFGEYFPPRAQAPQIELLSRLERDKESEQGGPNARARPARLAEFPEAPIDEFIEATEAVTQAIEVTVNALFPKTALWCMTNLSPRYRRVLHVKNSVLREQIDLAAENVQRGEVASGTEHMITRELKFAEKCGRKAKLDDQKFRDEIFGLILAGMHTTSAALAWIVKFLAESADVQARLRAELHAAYPAALAEGRNPTFAELNHVRQPYLEAVVEESLRCHSNTITREAQCDTELLGHKIPKGTTVFCVANGPGFYTPRLPVDDAVRSPSSKAAAVPKAWDEARDMRGFQPDRWLVPTETGHVEFDGTAGPQLIFGLGPRSCFGRRLAYIEMRMLTALVVWNFQLLPTPYDLSSHAAMGGVSERPKQCYVRLRPLS